MSDKEIEQEIVAKGLTALRITPGDIEANIVSEYFFTAEEGVIGQECFETGDIDAIKKGSQSSYDSLSLLTFCVLVLRNGFTVTGESACVSMENFDAHIGKKIARENAIKKIWPLMGYELRSNLAKTPRE